MMEQLKDSDVTEDEMSDVDREMFNRMNATEDGQLIGRVEDVNLESNKVRGEYVSIQIKTPVGEKTASFNLPETPTNEDSIVQLCKANGVDPKYPSMLEGCEVKWDSGSLVVPKTLKQKIVEPLEEVMVGTEDFYHVKMTFFVLFLPITLATYYLTVNRRDRHYMRQNLEDFGFHMLMWVFSMFGVSLVL